jgi:hypothetical protein
VKRPERQAKTKTLISRTPQIAAHGHAAKKTLSIYAAALGAMKRRVTLNEHRLAIAAMLAARRSGACAIVNVSG